MKVFKPSLILAARQGGSNQAAFGLIKKIVIKEKEKGMELKRREVSCLNMYVGNE